jgi:glycosyltransferase involved in cell wall biosynthesis
MKILHLSTNDIAGGAARASFRLHWALRKQDYDSTVLVAHRGSDDPTVTALVRSTDLATRLRRRSRRREILREFTSYQATRPTGLEPFSDDRSQHALDLVRQLPPCDVLYLHWVAGFVDYQSFFGALPRSTTVVWQLHDMNVMTGGCHYDQECGRHMSRCGACPQLGSTDPEDLSRQIWKRKQGVFGALEANRVHIVAPSRWMFDLAKASPLLARFPVTLIPNGVDLEEFAPRDRGVAREVLGIPQEAQVVMFVSDNLTNRRKGFSFLNAALSGMTQADNLFLLSVGEGKPMVTAPIPGLHQSHVTSDQWLSMMYSAADLFVIPSLQDNLPNTVLESMACGTPVVGFDVGGIPDMVRSGTTGQLVPVGDSVALGHAITRLLNAPSTCRQMAAECRRVVVEEYSYEFVVRRHAALFDSISHTS